MLTEKRTSTVDLACRVGKAVLRNPVIAASGTIGFGREAAAYFDISQLGGLAAKAVTREPRRGNPPARVAETASGMLNSVGLQNPGIEAYLAEELPCMERSGVYIVQNIAGDTVEDYVELARRLEPTSVPVLEMNLSCPNVHQGLAFGADPALIRDVVQAVREVWSRELWVKLTPNITSITAAAHAAHDAGADAVSLINTLLGLAIDAKTRRPVLHNNTGGLSGPAVKPVALRMVNEIYRAVDIPIVGMGGIMTAEDIVEFLLAGASAVQVGTASLLSPAAPVRLIHDLEEWFRQEGICSPGELTGQLKLW